MYDASTSCGIPTYHPGVEWSLSPSGLSRSDFSEKMNVEGRLEDACELWNSLLTTKLNQSQRGLCSIFK